MSHKGMGFLFTKSWHTSKYENIAKVWEAEEKQKNVKVKEKERATQLAKEREMIELGIFKSDAIAKLDKVKIKGKGKSAARSVSFLYEPPPGFLTMQEKEKQANKAIERQQKAIEHQKLQQQQQQAASLPALEPESAPSSAATSSTSVTGLSSSSSSSSSGKVALPSTSTDSAASDSAAGTERKKAKSLKEVYEEKFPFLKGAPTRGEWTKNLNINFKPLGILVRDVKCLRCGNFGHKSGDRECPLVETNPNDVFRQRLEDPMFAEMYKRMSSEEKEKYLAQLRMSGSKMDMVRRREQSEFAKSEKQLAAEQLHSLKQQKNEQQSTKSSDPSLPPKDRLVLKFQQDPSVPVTDDPLNMPILEDDESPKNGDAGTDDISPEEQKFLESLTEEEMILLLKQYKREEKRAKKKSKESRSHRKRKDRSRSPSPSPERKDKSPSPPPKRKDRSRSPSPPHPSSSSKGKSTRRSSRSRSPHTSSNSSRRSRSRSRSRDKSKRHKHDKKSKSKSDVSTGDTLG